MNNPTRYLFYEEVSWLENFKIMGRSERIKGLEIRNLAVKKISVKTAISGPKLKSLEKIRNVLYKF